MHAGQQAPSAAVIQVDRVKDNLYVLRGGGGNTAALVTTEGVVLVDGNVEFPPSVAVVAHENTASLMREMRPVTGGPEQPALFKDGNGLPRRSFKDQLTLGGGKDRIDLYYFGRAHTSGDAWIVFPELRVVHTGDVFPNKGIPMVDANNGGSGIEYPPTIARAVAGLKDVDTVITGHFDTALTVADLKMYGEFVSEIVETTQAAKRAGRSVDEIVKDWKVPERYIKAGYTQTGGDPRMGVFRLRTNLIQVIWKETQ